MKKLLLSIFILLLSFEAVYATPAKEDISFFDKKQRIIALYNSNNLEDAYQEISKIPEDGRDYELWYLLGNLAQDFNNDTTATFYFQKSLMLRPYFDKAHYNLGNIYYKEHKYVSAINEYKAAIKTKKDFPYYYYNMGCAYLELKEYKDAKSAFEKAIKLKEAPEFYYNLALALNKLNKEEEKKAALEKYKQLSGEK